MCRLLGIYGQVDFFKELISEFQNLSQYGKIPPTPDTPAGHHDGWGMARSNPEKTGMIPIDRQLGSAFQSQGFKAALNSITNPPHIFLCHLRKASPEVAVTLANTHPFFARGWALIHNGTVFDAERLPRDQSLKPSSDNSDTEYLLHYFLTHLFNKSDSSKDHEILRDATAAITLDYTAVNVLLSNGSDLFAIRNHTRHEDYYTLYYYHLPGSVIVCSQRLRSGTLRTEKWQNLPNRSIMQIHGDQPKIEILSF